MAAARLARSASKRWVNDDEVPQCPLCANRFEGSFLDITARGRTHCRYCGGVFCTDCCSKELFMPEDEVVRPPPSSKFKNIIFDPTLKQKACRTCVKILIPQQESIKASRGRGSGGGMLNGFLDRKTPSSGPHFSIVIVRAKSLQGRKANAPAVDPVCLLTVGNTSSITQPTQSSSDPVWDQCFDFPVQSEHGNSLKLTCYEEQAGGKTLIGEGSTKVVETGLEGMWVPITDEQRSVAGEVLVRCTYKGSRGARKARPAGVGGVPSSPLPSSYRKGGGGGPSSEAVMGDDDDTEPLPVLHWLQDKAWLVYVVLLLISVLYRFSLGEEFSGEPIPLRPGVAFLDKAKAVRSGTHYMTRQNDGNIVLRKGKPGDATSGKPVWESGRAYPNKDCRKCTAMVDLTGKRLVVKDGRNEVLSFKIAEDPVLSAAIRID